MTEMDSATKLFAKDLLLNNFTPLFHNKNTLDKVSLLFTEPSVISAEMLVNARSNILDTTQAAFEACIAMIMIIFLSPIFLLIFLGVKLTSHGPGLYWQRRVGKHGREFSIYKFRTMIQNAEEKSGAILSWQGDPRVTAFGLFLRSTHLDELPQLINVIKGEMSFIGPRPERQEIIKTFNGEIKGYHQRAVVLPGITGLAQICCPYDASPETKLKYDLYYILNKNSFLLNLLILIYTASKFFNGVFGDRITQQT